MNALPPDPWQDLETLVRSRLAEGPVVVATSWLPGRMVGDRLGWPEGLHVVDGITPSSGQMIANLTHVPVDHLELLGLRVNRLGSAAGQATLVLFAVDHFLDRIPPAALAEYIHGLARGRVRMQVEVFALAPQAPRVLDLVARLGLSDATPSIHKP